jgi:MFS family permease
VPPAELSSALDRATRKAIHRLVPFLLLMYVLAFLDRANIGFAKAAFQLDTGITDAAYAFGAGIFFAGYALLEIPSNLLMHRVGARLWMCRIMVTWGLVSAATLFVRSQSSFYWVRVLLGVAEAGFFPGAIYFLTRWFPAHVRTRVLGLFYFGAPLAFILGGPFSGALLEMNGILGLRGWQWLFLVEGLLAAFIGVCAFWYLSDEPSAAHWLSDAERRALTDAMRAEESAKAAHGPTGVVAALLNHHVAFLALIYFLIQVSVYGVVFYLPTQVAALMGAKVGWAVGVVSTIPWICALAATYVLPRCAERRGGHAGIASVALLVCAAGIMASVLAPAPLVALAGLCFAAAGFIAVQPLFWTYPTRYLSGSAVAGAIALINSFGVLGGFVAPNLKYWTDTATRSSVAGHLLLAATTAVAALLFLRLRRGAPAHGID